MGVRRLRFGHKLNLIDLGIDLGPAKSLKVLETQFIHPLSGYETVGHDSGYQAVAL